MCRAALGEGEGGSEAAQQERVDSGGAGFELADLAGVLRARLAEAEKLAEIAEDVSAGLMLDEVLERIFDRFREVIPYQRIGCAFLSDDGQMLTAQWARSEAPEVKIPSGFSAPVAGSSLQRVLDNGQPRIINDLESYLAEHPSSRSTRLIVEEGMRSSLTCPLVVRGRAVGVLFFSSIERNRYEGAHQATFMRIARELSVVIEKARVYQELHRAHEMLRAQVARDALTGLLNRGAVLEILEKEVATSVRRQSPLGVLMIDIDGFKAVNDTHGHLVGDAVLREIAQRLQRTTRSSDSMGRWGGEEFLAVLSDVGLETAVSAAERLREAVDGEPLGVDGRVMAVSVSIGVVVAREPAASSASELVAAADQKLYEAKARGRNCVAAGLVPAAPAQATPVSERGSASSTVIG